MSQKHPDFSRLAARISASNLQKNAPKTFSACVEQMFTFSPAAPQAAPPVAAWRSHRKSRRQRRLHTARFQTVDKRGIRAPLCSEEIYKVQFLPEEDYPGVSF